MRLRQRKRTQCNDVRRLRRRTLAERKTPPTSLGGVAHISRGYRRARKTLEIVSPHHATHFLIVKYPTQSTKHGGLPPSTRLIERRARRTVWCPSRNANANPNPQLPSCKRCNFLPTNILIRRNVPGPQGRQQPPSQGKRVQNPQCGVTSSGPMTRSGSPARALSRARCRRRQRQVQLRD